MTILVVGLVGILALFPVGIHASRSAVEDTTASILAQSVQESLILSLNTARPGQPVEYYHDGVPSGLTFALPAAGKTVDVPREAAGAKGLEVFRVSQQPKADFPNNFGLVDEDDQTHYGQYAFDFVVRPAGLSNLDTLYEFIVHLYRNHHTGGRNVEPVLTFNFQHAARK